MDTKTIRIKGLDINVGLDLDVKTKGPKGKNHLLGITTPDGIFCALAEVKVWYDDEEPVTVDLTLHSEIGEISILTNEENYRKLTAVIDEKIAESKGEET